MPPFSRSPSHILMRSLIAILVISFILVSLVPAPAAAAFLRATNETVLIEGSQIHDWLFTAFRSTSAAGNRERKGVRPSPAPSKAERETKVAKLELNVAADVELKSRQRLQLSAIPVDADGNAIQGLTALWESSA